MKKEIGQLKEENQKMKGKIEGGINALQVLFKFDSIVLKNNKMDLADCAPKLGFTMNELVVTSFGFGLF